MKTLSRLFCLLLIMLFCFPQHASAFFEFSDDRFQGEFTTENLDRIIQDYELYNDWYWTTPADIPQTFHGLQNSPGWTDTGTRRNRNNYVQGIYGCRWLRNQVSSVSPGGGYGECFGFAMFIGYLLSGEKNPYTGWKKYYGLIKSDGLRVGDILRAEYDFYGKKSAHSAVVYSVTENEILFLQVSGSSYNRISIGTGFSDRNFDNPTTLDQLLKIPGTKVCRAPQNIQKPEKNKP